MMWPRVMYTAFTDWQAKSSVHLEDGDALLYNTDTGEILKVVRKRVTVWEKDDSDTDNA